MTLLVLIPKKPGADSMDAFKPISLCKFVYKIFSKVLMVMLLALLPSIISPQQNGFLCLGDKL